MADDDERPDTGTRKSVVVCTRFRPQNKIELGREAQVVVQFPSPEAVVVTNEEGNDQMFTFDRVYDMDSEQKDVFSFCCRPLIDDICEGYHATCFAYGQTGSGKTFTMEGVHDDERLKGIIPRSMEYLFQRVQNAKDTEFTVEASYVEIYMEKVRDLLDKTKKKDNLEVRVDAARGVYIENVTELPVFSEEDAKRLLDLGSATRHVSATGMNEVSSRSHALFMLTVTQKSKADMTTKSGKLFLVDLAGSEMVGKTGAKDKLLDEAKAINKSLSALGNVIKALTEPNKAGFVPYRDSKLTRILQDSLGGGARACLIIACSPSSYNAIETISTLRFGSRAKAIKNKLRVHTTFGGGGGAEFEGVMMKKEEEITRLQAMVAAMEAEVVQVKRENVVYTTIYGEAPKVEEKEDGTLVVVKEDAEGNTKEEAMPTINMHAQVAIAEDRVNLMQEELEAVAKEANLTRPMVSEFEKHLIDERSLFGQLRSDIAKLFKRLQSGGPGENSLAKEKYLDVDRLLGMAKWKAETMLGKVKPVTRASAQVAAKAAATAKAFKEANEGK
ncbi:hypothetical protein CYMTET_53970 [Cymbomonas tetramitiformis]|uniref:Kinesin-like protein n=1 Tax=Cymbomonas tetramitiformis TaxID=36881 RepID=A0AAE0BHP9_9CHLO|nr:hypothetical protein CYMTET_53970 [Cymbomonas tetramitiformis]|eukprot:gene11113-13131_t